MEITREIQFDAGHRIPFHKAKCRNVHGHRYRIIAVLEGEVVTRSGVSDQGMVMDFGEVKRILMEKIHDPLDHGFMVWKDDKELREFLTAQGYRTVVMDDVPTAENIARWCFRQCVPEFVSVYGNQLRLKAITVWETPNSSATFSE
jgi:6-pyruvoyltetrahydropterin/6-carboxytetrahydropterin synthase